MRITKPKIFIASFILILFLGVALIHGSQLVAMGAAYKAKMLCSEVFVAGRSEDAVLADLVVDDLAALKYIDVLIDKEMKTITSSFYGIAKSKVHYRKNGGCALASNTAPSTSSKKYTQKQRSNNIHVPEYIKSNDISNQKLLNVVDEAFSEPDPEHLRRTRAIVILHKGQIVAERYAADIKMDIPLLGWSMTKSVMNALVGILISEGRLTLDTPIHSESWADPSDPRQYITVRHLLNMSSGLKFNEDMSDPLADVSRMILQERDMAAFAADMPLEVKPGSRWQYSSGNTILLAEYLRRLLGEDEYQQFPRKVLFSRLGMTNAVIETDASGTFVGSSFMYATAREWARFGLLYLQDGVWEGERIFPEGWLKYTQTSALANLDVGYGAHFWLGTPSEYRGKDVTLPENTFHAIGHEGQFVTVVPSHDAVIVRFGKTRYAGAWEHDVFVNKILAALRESS